MKALSIQSPWSWLIALGHKNVENRSRGTSFRGQFLIHAGKTMDQTALNALLSGHHPVTGEKLTPGFYRSFAVAREANQLRLGGIVGVATLVDCVAKDDAHLGSAYTSPWFVGPHGYLLKDARPLPFVPFRGQLGFFDVPDDLVQDLKQRVRA